MHEHSQSYIAQISNEHRRKHGQFFTPFEIAIFMCKWAMDGGAEEIFDPAFGMGSYYDAAKTINPSISFKGMDIDHTILEYFQSRHSDGANVSITCADYLTQWQQSHSSIVCNPPYMRFQNFINRDKVHASVEKHLQVRLSGYTNIASVFLMKALSELPQSGRLAFIMPMEFLNTGYGTIIKERLLQHGALKALIKLEPEREVFPDATTSVGIILVCKDGMSTPIQFYNIEHLRDLEDILLTAPIQSANSESLDPSEKWFKYFQSRKLSFHSPNLVPISYYGEFSRGIATGANAFFVLSASQATELGIPRSHLLSCITKSMYAKTGVFTQSDFDDLEKSNTRVLLLNAGHEPPEQIQNYLRSGEESGFHLRYLTKMRNPWHKLEYRVPAPLLFGVFSRDKFKVVRNLSSAINLTCYHCFYPNLFGNRLCDALFLYFQSRSARQILSVSMRHYGDGLRNSNPTI